MGSTKGNRTNNQHHLFLNVGGMTHHSTSGAGYNSSSITIDGNGGCQSVKIRGNPGCQTIKIRGNPGCQTIKIRGNPGCQTITIRGNNICQDIPICGNSPSVNIGMNSVTVSSEEYSEKGDWDSSISPHQAEAAVVPNNGPSTGTPTAVIDSLPTYIMKGEDHEECLICLDDTHDGAEFCLLPCMHRYHAPCIREWLTRNPTCPVCGNSILET